MYYQITYLEEIKNIKKFEQAHVLNNCSSSQQRRGCKNYTWGDQKERGNAL